MFQDLSKIKQVGFTGFKTIEQLWVDQSSIPDEKGVYIVINPDCTRQSFLSKGVGGYFKKTDPNVSLNKLGLKWVNDCPILYIGQAGGGSSSATLKQRIKQYLDFGKGKAVGHKGGRYIWQLSHYKDLIVAWKTTKSRDPLTEENKLLIEFHNCYRKLPFANLRF